MTKSLIAGFLMVSLGAFAGPALSQQRGLCADDAARLCPGIGIPQQVATCLRSKLAEVSAPCRASLEKPAPAPSEPGACRKAIAQVCGEIPAGEGRLQKCIDEHAKELAPACRTRTPDGAADKADRAAGKPAAACQVDVQKHCTGVAPGEGRIRACLEEHRSTLTPDCLATLPKAPLRAFSAACSEDLAKFCKDVQLGEGRGKRCLEDHVGELSPACRTAVGK